MPIGVALFNGTRLTQARAARGLTAVNLSDLAGISPSSISLYEKGAQKPQQQVLDRLASALNVPVDFFYDDVEIEKPRTVFYRSMSSATKHARVRAEARFEWAVEVIEYLLNFFDYPELNLPDLEIPKHFRELDTNQIESLANQVREYWNLGFGPITNMLRTLESNGILVWRTALEAETLDAFSECRTPHPIIVLSSDKENYYRSRFDAAHELGHIILHRHIEQATLNRSSDMKVIEDQAHLFAGAFLLPATTYSKDLWAPTLDAFRSLKPRWNASIAMQIMRSRHLGLVTEQQQKRLWINLARRKWRATEPLDDSTPAEKPTLIGNSIKMLIEENVRTKEQLVKDLSLYPQDIENICELPLGYLRNGNDSESQLRLKIENNKIIPFKR